MNILAFGFKICSLFNEDFSLENAYSISWILSNVMIASLSVLVFLIGNHLGSVFNGIIGGLLSLLSIILIQHSQFAIVDVPMAFFTTFFFTISIWWLSHSELSLNKLYFLSFLIGVVISMKYTGALLFIPFFIIVYQFIKLNQNLRGSKSFQILLTGIIGCLLLIVSSFLILKKGMFILELTKMTSDGILEIEYLNLLATFSKVLLILSFVFISISILISKKVNYWSGNLFSPIYLKLMGIIIFSFCLFSPFTIIEWKKSFADFFYEYRHMQIGSAAQYHHESNEYKSLIQSINNFYPIKFYFQLFINNFGRIGLVMAFFGFFQIIKKGNAAVLSMLLFLLLMIITITGWQNVAVRYSLSIVPIIYVLIPFGIQWLNTSVINRWLIKSNFIYWVFSGIVITEQLFNWIKIINL